MNNYIILLTATIIAVYLCIQNIRLKKLIAENDFFESSIKNFPLGIYMKDLHGNIIISNKELSKIKGIPENELMKKNIKDIFQPEDISIIANGDKEVIKTGKALSFERVFNNHNYNIIKSPIFDKKENISGFVIVFKNIDKEKELEANKETFIATLTHDLKSPTSAQINMLNLLMKGHFGKLNPEQHEMVRLTCCSCKYISELVSTILSTYSYDCCALKLNPQNFDLVELISSLACSSEYLASDKEQNIVFNHNMKNCIIYADRLQIKRVIVNLLSNAITYGFEKSTIKIDLLKSKNFIELSIENKSRQIPESDLKKLFKRFTKTEMSHFNKASTSLGLYLSKQIIDLHKGEIYAKSYEDGTCIFGFRLPEECKEKELIKK